MKRLALILFAAALTASAAPVTSLHVKAVLLEKLRAFQTKADGLYAFSGDVLTVGDHSIDLMPVVESEATAQGKNIVAMRIEVAVDGVRQSEATFGAIGIAATQEDAVAVGLGEWYLGFGLPFLQAIRGGQSAMILDDYEVFAGALGLRGGAALGWVDGTDAMNRKILAALLPAIAQGGDFVTLELKVMVRSTGRPDSESRVNGLVSPDIAARLIALDWPQAADSYMFKQAFVLKKRKPGHS